MITEKRRNLLSSCQRASVGQRRYTGGVKQDNEKGAAMMQGVGKKVRVASKENRKKVMKKRDNLID